MKRVNTTMSTKISSIHWSSVKLKELAEKQAKAHGKSLSSYVRDLVEKDVIKQSRKGKA